jgi:hypothetical protein
MIGWLMALAILRVEGQHGSAVGVAQLPPTVGLVLALALLLELASAGFGPSAGDNASGVAAAVAITRALDAAPPRQLTVELVLQGAGEGGGVGLRRYLRARRRELQPSNVVVIGVAPCAAGRPSWWISDGQLVPLRYFARLRELCERIARDEPHLGATPHRGRGATPALHARGARLPAIAIGCLDERGLTPHSHQSADRPEAIDPDALDVTVEFALMLVDAIDGYVGRMPQTPQSPARQAPPAVRQA